MFDAIDKVMGYKDNVNPPLLIHSETDFSSLEYTTHKSDSESDSQNENDNITPNPLIKDDKNNRKRGCKKRRHSSSPKHKEVLDLLMQKWQKEEEQRDEDRELQRQREEARDKRDVEVLNTMKTMTNILERLTRHEI